MAIDPITAGLIFGGGTLLSKLFGGGEKPDVTFSSSPQQQQILNQIMPLIQRLSTQGQGGPPAFGIPNPEALLPSAGFLDRLDPNVRAGLFEPFDRGLDILEGRLSGRGALGNPRAGISGAAADVFGQFGRDILPQIATTAFRTVQPALQQGFNALLQREQAPFNSLLGLTNQSLPTGLVQPGQQNAFGQGIDAFTNFFLAQQFGRNK